MDLLREQLDVPIDKTVFFSDYETNKNNFQKNFLKIIAFLLSGKNGYSTFIVTLLQRFY